MPERPKLIIEFTDNGRIQVTGPIADKVLAYGMLEAAKDAVRDYSATQERRVQPVTLVPKIELGN
jgi:hypothetical protein